MPLALLLSPDDQAVSVITAILEEMSVTCERPLDGASAAQKLNSNSFDLVVVDCENLPAAKLIFDVCRRGKGGNNPVQIAIVDGRAGLPTAFRLGAELILTKPVAKDQARNTIRTAVGRVKKEDPARASHVAEQVAIFSTDALDHEASSPGAVQSAPLDHGADHPIGAMEIHELSPERASYSAPQARAMAAAAGVGVSQLTSYSDPVPAQTLSSAATVSAITVSAINASAPVLTSSAPAFTATMSAAVAEPENVSVSSAETPATSAARASSVAAEPNARKEEKLSEDPVMAELEQAEAEPKAEPAPVAAAPQEQEKPSKPKAAQAERGGKSRGSLVALFALLLACAGFYFAWAYEPGFQALVQSQVNRARVLAGLSHPVKPAPPTPVKPAAQPVGPQGESLAAPAQSSQVSLSSPNATGNAATASAIAPATTPSSATPASTNLASTKPATAGPTSATPVPVTPATTATGPAAVPAPAKKPTPSQPDLKKPEPVKAIVSPSPATQSKDAAPSDAEMPWEKTTVIILSSKGAEKRLMHSVQPTYSAGAHPDAADGTMVLKALIDDNGKVTSARVVEGNAALAQAAISAVMQFRYHPYVRDGKALPFQTVVLLDFPRP